MSDTSTSYSYTIVPFGFIAALISYALNHSFWWAVLHWFCGAFYILYAICIRGKEIIPAVKALFGI